MIICRSLFLGLVILICTSQNGCSKPTKPLSPTEILEALLNLPPYPSPPMTEENESNASYQRVAQGCTGPNLVLLGYKSKIQRLISKEIEAVNIEGDWQWISSEYGTTITLTVVPKDTLTFVMNDEHDGKHYVTVGWILPKGQAAEIITETEYVKWDRDGDTLSCKARIVTSIFSSRISQTGEGRISVNRSNLQVFLAEWDSHGHGFYQTSTGSGSW